MGDDALGGLRLPDVLLARAHAMCYPDDNAGEPWQPPAARGAATVVLIDSRDRRVCFLRRSQALAFAPGMFVFPGGAVDAVDGDGSVGLINAAMRETFEEVGVLLAADRSDRLVDCAEQEWWLDRHDGLAIPADFYQALQQRGLRAAAHRMTFIAHWVTPEVESRRYDTRFYAAVVPEGQTSREYIGETDETQWWYPSDVRAGHARGEIPLLPPTLAVVAELADGLLDHLLASRGPRHRPEPIMPRPRATGHGNIAWDLVNAYSGEPLRSGVAPPARSEHAGTRHNPTTPGPRNGPA